MSYIRNVRNKYDQSPWKPDSTDPNPYYEEYLRENDKSEIRGFDWASEQDMPDFFLNLDIFSDEIEEKDFDTDKVDTNILMADEVTEEMLEKSSRETRIIYWLKTNLADWLEMQRNELVTSMIDGITKDEYRENYKKVWGIYPDEEK